MSDKNDEKPNLDKAVADFEALRRESEAELARLRKPRAVVTAGERVAVPVESPTVTDLKVVLSPEARAAAEAAMAEGEDVEDISVDVEDGWSPAERQAATAFTGTPDEHEKWFANGDKPPPADEADDGADLAPAEPQALASPPDVEDKRLAAEVYGGKWRRWASVAALPIVLVGLISVVIWKTIPAPEPRNLIKLIENGQVERARALAAETIAKIEEIARQSTPTTLETPESDIMMVASVSIPDVVSYPDAQGVVTTVTQTPVESALVNTTLPPKLLWRPAEIEVATLSRREPQSELLSDRTKVPMEVVGKAGVLPPPTGGSTAKPQPLKVASGKVGVVPTEKKVKPHLQRGRTSAAGATRDSTLMAASAPAAVTPPPAPTPVGLEVGAVYEVYEQPDGSLVFKKVTR